MDKELLLQELQKSTSARENRLRLANLVLTSYENFSPLLELSFATKNKLSVKAAWVLEFVVYQKIEWLLKNIIFFTKNIAKVSNGSAVRSMAKICELFARYLDKNPEEKVKYTQNIEDIIECGFDWMLSNHKIAIKVYTMQTLYLFGKDYAWIYPELRIILEKNIHSESIGYKNRALKVLKWIG